MAGSLSNHLINSHHPESPFNSSIVTHGPMSYAPMMHGTPYAQQSFSLFNSQPSFANDSISEETARKIATLRVKLNQKLGPEYISQRPGPGGGPKLTYVEGWRMINLANEVFGFNCWSSSIVSLTTDFADYSEETRRYSVGVTAIIRVTLKDGVFHEDTGYGMLENSKSKGAALDKCKKEAVTDGLKRALRNFGNVMGNCLYDKSYTSEVVKVKFEKVKFNQDELHRRPEFDPNLSTSSASTSAGPSNQSTNRPHQNQVAAVTPTRPSYQQNQAKPITSVPAHMRSGLNTSTTSGSTSASNTSFNQSTDHKGKGRANQQRLDAITAAITTPAQRYNAQQQQQQNQRPAAAVTPAPPPVSKPPAPAAGKPTVKPEPNLDDDDSSYGFGSEDDALFAMADLGPNIAPLDVDLGRPIESDIDTGRPIDQEEGLLQSMQDAEDDGAVFAVHPGTRSAAAAPGAGARAGASASSSGAGKGARASAGAGGAKSSSSSSANSSMTRKELIALALGGGSATTSSAGASSSAAQMPPPAAPPQNQNSKSSSISQQNHQRYMNQRQQQQQQHSGGFSYPSGSGGGAAASAIVSTTNGNSTSVGVKRPIEATAGSSSNYRGARPGMGLQQGQTASASASSSTTTTANANGKRAVLGSLDVEEGGSVKRARQW